MQKFTVKWRIPYTTVLDGRNRSIFKLKLDDQWAIVLVMDVRSATLKSIEIHRINTAGKFLVSGALGFGNENFDSAIYKDEFSELIKTGSSFTTLVAFTYVRQLSCPHLHGHVHISDLGLKQACNSANGESMQRIQLKSLEKLSKDFEQLVHQNCFADVTLKCDGVSIPAHKVILSARSPVFAAMFAHPMKESLKNEVHITDINVSTLRTLLVYVCSGKISDLTASSSADLLFAAEKYQLEDLKTVCAHFLKNTLTPQNVWKILVLGDMLSEDLKSFAVDYICNRGGKFSFLESTQEWKDLRKNRPDLAMDLLESLVKHRDEKQNC